MLDGARNALLGYLFQLLSTASVVVREVGSVHDAWADLIALIGNGVVCCEEFGQDALVRPLGLPHQGAASIQFKHSANASVIQPAELIDILLAFDRSRADAAASGVTISQYVLVSNRQLDSNLQQLLGEARNSHTSPTWLQLRPATKKGKPIAENHKRLAPYGGDPGQAAKAMHAVLRALTVPPTVTFEADLARLRRFAARYGVLDSEWDARLNALIGALVTETANGKRVEITREWLKSQLVGDSTAANLEFGSAYSPHMSAHCRVRLDDQAKVRHRISQEYLVVRDALQTIRDQVALNPVVFVYGHGGCGKSLAVEEYLRSVCDSQVVWSESAMHATETAIVDAINRVRSPNCTGGVPDRFLSDLRKRMEVANSQARRLIMLDLDGVDEDPGRRGEIHQLISICWAEGRADESPASLIITCRAPAAGDLAHGLLVNEWIGTAESDLVRGVGFVLIEDFTDRELIQAAELLNGQPERRILNALIPPQPEGRSVRLPDSKPVRDDILQALRHPVVWGGYASLAAETDRDGVLDGNGTNLAVLAQQLLSRFLKRCCLRKNWNDTLMLENALCAAARLVNGSPPFPFEEWQRGCGDFLNHTEAGVLYNESLSYGFVQRDAGATWRWGHRFVVDFLANQPDPRGK